jgi:hypothetical protein
MAKGRVDTKPFLFGVLRKNCVSNRLLPEKGRMAIKVMETYRTVLAAAFVIVTIACPFTIVSAIFFTELLLNSPVARSSIYWALAFHTVVVGLYFDQRRRDDEAFKSTTPEVKINFRVDLSGKLRLSLLRAIFQTVSVTDNSYLRLKTFENEVSEGDTEDMDAWQESVNTALSGIRDDIRTLMKFIIGASVVGAGALVANYFILESKIQAVPKQLIASSELLVSTSKELTAKYEGVLVQAGKSDKRLAEIEGQLQRLEPLLQDLINKLEK